jgi:hypothetical protein
LSVTEIDFRTVTIPKRDRAVGQGEFFERWKKVFDGFSRGKWRDQSVLTAAVEMMFNCFVIIRIQQPDALVPLALAIEILRIHKA